MSRLARFRKSFFAHYKFAESVARGVTVGLVLKGKIMWIEVCLALMTPERIFFTRLQCVKYHNEIHTMLGPLRFPQFSKWPTPDFVKHGLCIIDYFAQRDLPEPEAFVYLNKVGVIVTEHGWTSEYSKKCSVCCVYYFFRRCVLSFLSEFSNRRNSGWNCFGPEYYSQYERPFQYQKRWCSVRKAPKTGRRSTAYRRYRKVIPYPGPFCTHEFR